METGIGEEGFNISNRLYSVVVEMLSDFEGKFIA